MMSTSIFFSVIFCVFGLSTATIFKARDNSASCRDYSYECRYYNPRTYCKRQYFRDRCKKLCGVCKTSPVTTAAPTRNIIVGGDRITYRQTSSSKCSDVTYKCRYIKPSVHCKDSYFIYRCKKTCGLCKSTTTAPTTTTTTKVIITEGCKDKLSTSRCEAYKRSGYCKYERTLMIGSCSKTCGYCNVCEDKEKDTKRCLAGKTMGHCHPASKYYGTWSTYCKKTCGFCECHDKLTAQECVDYITKGLCVIHNTVKQAKEYCSKTCKYCKVPPTNPPTAIPPVCKDVYDKKNCEAGRDKSYCHPAHSSYKYWSVNCKRTCGFCECHDKLTLVECIDYLSKKLCSNPSTRDRAKEYCGRSCGFCTLNKICKNKVPEIDCVGISARGGCPSNEAKQKCRRFCKYCTDIPTRPPTTATTTTTTTTTATTTTTTTTTPTTPTTTTATTTTTTTTTPTTTTTTTTTSTATTTTTTPTTTSTTTTTTATPTTTSTTTTASTTASTTTATSTTEATTTATTMSTNAKAETTKKIIIEISPTTSTTKRPNDCGLPVNKGRMAGGKDSVLGQWPWQGSLYVNNEYKCGVVLIKPGWVMLPTHCVDSFDRSSNYTVIFADTDQSQISSKEKVSIAKSIINHPKFQKDKDGMSLIKLEKPIILSNYIKTICLPDKTDLLMVGQKCFVSGWSKYKPGGHLRLQHASIRVAENKKCDKTNDKSATVDSNVVCVSDHKGIISTCDGEIGNSLVCQSRNGRWYLHGMNTWVSKKCNNTNSVFMRIKPYKEWIDKLINDQ